GRAEAQLAAALALLLPALPGPHRHGEPHARADRLVVDEALLAVQHAAQVAEGPALCAPRPRLALAGLAAGALRDLADALEGVIGVPVRRHHGEGRRGDHRGERRGAR